MHAKPPLLRALVTLVVLATYALAPTVGAAEALHAALHAGSGAACAPGAGAPGNARPHEGAHPHGHTHPHDHDRPHTHGEGPGAHTHGPVLDILLALPVPSTGAADDSSERVEPRQKSREHVRPGAVDTPPQAAGGVTADTARRPRSHPADAPTPPPPRSV